MEKNNSKKIICTLAILTGCLGVALIGTTVALCVTESHKNTYSGQLENVYQKNMFDLTDSINNTETKLSKVLASNNANVQNKLLVEIAHDAELALQSVSSLPIETGDFSNTIKFINQVNGYTTTISKKLSSGGHLSTNERKSLDEIRQRFVDMKSEINKIMESNRNYSILDNSINFSNDKNFTITISKIQGENLDYPTMIYDGPFSDSETNKEIKGLVGQEISQEDAYTKLEENFNNVLDFEYQGETNGKFETYNYKITSTFNDILFAQISKIGGNIITVSGYSKIAGEDDLSLEDAEKIAIDFAKANGIENAICVWKDELNNAGYFNIAPIQNNIILYPDLVKVKIDLTKGTVIGYDATLYFTNHTKRLLPNAQLTEQEAKDTLPNSYNYEKGRLVLAPLEYSREVLCYEFKGQKNGETYYFYTNALNGNEENILKVVETEDGSKLM